MVQRNNRRFLEKKKKKRKTIGGKRQSGLFSNFLHSNTKLDQPHWLSKIKKCFRISLFRLGVQYWTSLFWKFDRIDEYLSCLTIGDVTGGLISQRQTPCEVGLKVRHSELSLFNFDKNDLNINYIQTLLRLTEALS